MPQDIQSSTIDVHWTADGDLFHDHLTGDLGLADAMDNLVLEGAVLRRLQSNHGEWRLTPNLGCNLSEFMGMPNTAETAIAIHNRIVGALTGDALIKPGNLSVDIIPISNHKILILLEIKAIMPFVDPVTGKVDNTIIIGFSYDMRDNRMVPRITGA